VHALEQVMRDSPDHHDDVNEVLTQFIRGLAPLARQSGHQAWMHPVTGSVPDLPAEPTPDVQATLTALAHRPLRPERQPINLHHLRLTNADLDGANLTGAHLHGANLTDASLDGADLTRAHLHGADLTGAYLTGAWLTGANLTVVDGTSIWIPSHDQRQCSLSTVSFTVAIRCRPGIAVHQVERQRGEADLYGGSGVT